MLDTIMTAIISGLVTGIGTVLTLKTEVNWIKMTLTQYNDRLTHLERN